MDTLLPPVSPVVILAAIWATFLLTNLAPPSSEYLVLVFALVGYLAAYALYPAAVVLGSKVVAASAMQRQFTLVGVASFLLLMLSRSYSLGAQNQATAILALAALALVWYQFGSALTSAEARKQSGDRRSTPALWLALLLFPFLGAFYVHMRYRGLVNHAEAT